MSTQTSEPARDLQAGVVASPARRRRRGRTLLALVSILTALILLAVLAMACYLLLSSRALLYQGITEIDQARSQLSSVTDSASAERSLTRAAVSVRQAHGDFATADGRLQRMRPVLEQLGWLPLVGDQLTTAPSAAKLARTTSEGLLVLLQGLRPLVHEAQAGRSGHRMQQLTAGLSSQTGSFTHAYHLFSSAMRIRRSLPRRIPAQLASGLRTLDTQLPPLRTAAWTLSLAPGLLGAAGPRTYLIAYQDPYELRATGGFIGSIGLVKIHGGSMTQRFMDSEIGNREKLLVPAPEPIRLYNEIWWLLRDSNWSPNFPTTAALERYFLRMDLGVQADGVINVTPQAVATVLEATGPMYVPEYRRWVTAQNVEHLTDYYTHWASNPGPLAPGQSTPFRKQFIAIVGQHLLARMEKLDISGWMRLAAHLQGAIERRDLLVNFSQPREQHVVRLLGAAGAIDPTTADYLYVVDTNLSYNKINPYIHVSTAYDLTVRPDRWLDARLTLHLRNEPEPAAKLTQGWGPGGGNLGGPDDYADFLRVYAPIGAQLVDQSGWTNPWTPGDAYGKTEFCGYIIVKRGDTATIRLHYVVPPNALTWSGGRRYRLSIQHQPGNHPDAITVSVRDGSKMVGHWHLAHPQRDWSMTVPIASRSIHPIPLPKEQPSIVAPGHWVEPHAFLKGPHLSFSGKRRPSS